MLEKIQYIAIVSHMLDNAFEKNLFAAEWWD